MRTTDSFVATETVEQARGIRSPLASTAAFVGNTSTHRFHKPTCRYFTCPNCTARFNTRQEAIEAGYRPGGCCDP